MLIGLIACGIKPSAIQANSSTGVLFDGTNGVISVANSTGLNLSGAFTLEAWIYPHSLSGQKDLIYKWSAGGYVNQRSYFLQLYNDQLEFSVNATGLSANNLAIGSNTRLQSNVWTHVAGVYDGTNLNLYINGSKDSAYISEVGGAFTGNAPVFIGGTGSFGYERFDGGMDEVRISDIVRYTSNFTPTSSEFVLDSHTVLLLHMNEGSGTNTTNFGLVGGNGYLNSGVFWNTGYVVPEPSTFILVGLGLLPLLCLCRRTTG